MGIRSSWSRCPILFLKEVQTMRKRLSRGKDRRVFSQTADKTKRVNVRPVVTRGGFRL